MRVCAYSLLLQNTFSNRYFCCYPLAVFPTVLNCATVAKRWHTVVAANSFKLLSWFWRLSHRAPRTVHRAPCTAARKQKQNARSWQLWFRSGPLVVATLQLCAHIFQMFFIYFYYLWHFYLIALSKASILLLLLAICKRVYLIFMYIFAYKVYLVWD